MLETVLMMLAVFLMVFGILSFIAKVIAFKETPLYDAKGNMTRKSFRFDIEIIMISISLSYLIWYCN